MALAVSSLRTSLANAPVTTLSSTLASMPNVERTRRSKSASRHCATTRVFTGSELVRANINDSYFEAGCSRTGSYFTEEVPVPASGFTLSVR